MGRLVVGRIDGDSVTMPVGDPVGVIGMKLANLWLEVLYVGARRNLFSKR